MRLNRQEIEAVYNEYSKRLFLASFKILGNSQEAEDVMQETVLNVCTSHNIPNINNLGAYLMRSCINKSLDIVRKRKTAQAFLSDMKTQASEEDTVAEDSKRANLIQIIISLIAKLPQKYRQIVSLKLIEGYDYQEISEIVAQNENSIRSKFMRGRQKLATLLKEEGIYEKI